MPFYLILLVTMLTHVAFKGSKVLISLYAIELGANPLLERVVLRETVQQGGHPPREMLHPPELRSIIFVLIPINTGTPSGFKIPARQPEDS